MQGLIDRIELPYEVRKFNATVVIGIGRVSESITE